MDEEYNPEYACFETCRREHGVMASDYTLAICIFACRQGFEDGEDVDE